MGFMRRDDALMCDVIAMDWRVGRADGPVCTKEGSAGELLCRNVRTPRGLSDLLLC